MQRVTPPPLSRNHGSIKVGIEWGKRPRQLLRIYVVSKPSFFSRDNSLVCNLTFVLALLLNTFPEEGKSVIPCGSCPPLSRFFYHRIAIRSVSKTTVSAYNNLQSNPRQNTDILNRFCYIAKSPTLQHSKATINKDPATR